jgi:hypothetical protein
MRQLSSDAQVLATFVGTSVHRPSKSAESDCVCCSCGPLVKCFIAAFVMKICR